MAVGECEGQIGEALAQAIIQHRKAFDIEEAEAEIALALRWTGAPSYERIHAFGDQASARDRFIATP